MSNKEKELVIEDCYVCFISSIIGMIVVQELPLNVTHMILGWNFSMLFIDSKDTEAKVYYTSNGDIDGFFHADAHTNVYSWIMVYYF